MSDISIYLELASLKQDLIGIREELGDPRLKTLAFGNPPESELVFISPKVPFYTVPTKYIGLPLDPSNSRISVGIDDWLVKDIPRTYPRELFYRKAWVNPVLNDSGVVTSGISCRSHVIDDESGLSYNLILKKDVEQVRL